MAEALRRSGHRSRRCASPRAPRERRRRVPSVPGAADQRRLRVLRHVNAHVRARAALAVLLSAGVARAQAAVEHAAAPTPYYPPPAGISQEYPDLSDEHAMPYGAL